MTLVYVAAPLFSPSSRTWNRQVAAALSADGLDVFLPQDVGGSQRPSRREIFSTCMRALDAADIVVVIVDGPDVDSGTAWEIGYAFARGIPIVNLRTDYRGAEGGAVNIMIEFSGTLVERRDPKGETKDALGALSSVIDSLLSSGTLSTGTHQGPTVGVGVLIVKDGRVLLGRRRRTMGAGDFGWCGGRVEAGESLQAAAQREVMEEAGMTLRKMRFLCVSSLLVDGEAYVDVEFLGESDDEPREIANERIGEWGWHPLSDLPSPLFAPARVALEAYLENRTFVEARPLARQWGGGQRRS